MLPAYVSAENIILQDVYRVSDDSVSVTLGQNPRSIQEGCSSSPTSCKDNSNSGFYGRRSLELREECLANINSGIIETNHSKRGASFIFQGYINFLSFSLLYQYV